LSNVDTPVRVASSISYELPVGKGRAFLGNINRVADLLIGGWSVNAVSVYQTGFPLQIYQTNANSAYGYDTQRPNLTGSAIGTSGSVEARLNNYLNASAFSVVPQGAFGNTPRTLSTRGPGTKNWDLSVFKDFRITERAKAQFRAEALNGFNSPQFHTPNTDLSSGQFGVINTVDNFARQLQLAIRVTF
jgi:trimeric autotransporter adhesin